MKRNTTVSVFSFWVLIIQFTACWCLKCPIATKWDQENKICADCDHGTFMPEHEHNHTECYPCNHVTDVRNEYVIRECSLQEDALIGSSRSNKTPCLDDTFYIRVNSDGVKVCTVRTMPCKQEQFFVSGHTCEPCPPGTYMVDNHHNNTACSSCQQLPHNQEVDSYVATACNITRSLPDVDKNSTDQMHAAPTEKHIDDVVWILQIIVAVFLIVLILPLFKCVNKGIKKHLSGMNCLSDKEGILAICMMISMVGLSVCLLVTSFVKSKDSIFILLMRCFGGLFVVSLIIIGILYKLLYDVLSQKASCGCEKPLHE